MQTFSSDHLKEFSIQVFLHFGISKIDANQAAEVLRLSDLRGIDSHGVARLHTYFDMLTLGKINSKPNIKIIRDKKSVCTVDGDNGLGLVVGPKANEIAMDKADVHGSGWERGSLVLLSSSTVVVTVSVPKSGIATCRSNAPLSSGANGARATPR